MKKHNFIMLLAIVVILLAGKPMQAHADGIENSTITQIKSENEYTKVKLTKDDMIQYFKISISQASEVTFQLKSYIKGTVQFDIVNTEDVSVMTLNCINKEGDSYGYKIQRTLLDKGDYYIRIYSPEGVTGIVYALYYTTALKTNDDVINNTIETMQPILMNKTYKCSSSLNDKIDYFVVDLKKDGLLTVTLSSKVKGKLKITVRKSTGGFREEGISSCDYSSGNPVTTKYVYEQEVEAGKYIICVDGTSNPDNGLYYINAKGYQQIDKMKISSKLSLATGASYVLKPTISPSTATEKINYYSYNKSIATVTCGGKITAVKNGTVKIRLKSADGGVVKYVTVTVADVKVTGVSLNVTSKTMYIGKTYTLKVTVKPTNAKIKTVTWSSSNSKVAAVSSKGVVTAKTDGTTIIKVTTKDGSKTATCKITVKAVPVTGVTISKTSASINVGESFTLSASVQPTNAKNQNVTWSSSDPSVASVSTSGKVTAKKAGNATIKVVTADGGYQASCKVSVVDPNKKTEPEEKTEIDITQLTNLKSSVLVYANGSVQLTISYLPVDATRTKLTWTSIDETVATVTQDGKVTGVSKGITVITVKAQSGVTATCTIVVE